MAKKKTTRAASAAKAKTAAKKKTSSSASKSTARNKAQAEFDKYRARQEAERAATSAGSPGSTGSTTFGAPGLWMGTPVPAWGSPPSVAPLGQPQFASLPRFAPPPQLPTDPALPVDVAPVTERLGSTLRLGVELLNASLAGSIRLLDGVTGMTSGVAGAISGHGQYSNCGCSDYYDDGCSYDCCYVMGCDCGCCEPSVGSCC